jgi:two-component system, cell cycle sensor histidine kinase and response regulator CckA
MFQRVRLVAAAGRTILGHFGITIGSVILALLLSLLFRPLIEPNPFLLFFASIALSAWAGGLRPGLLATGLAALLSNYFLLSPMYEPSLSPTDLIRLGAFILVGVLISALSEARLRAVAAQHASEARKSAIVSSALDGIITIDAAGRVLDFNPAAERIFSYQCAEVVGRELADLIVPPALREQHRQGLARCVATGEGALLGKYLEMTALRADGSEFPVELTLTRIATTNQPIFIGFIRDLTVRKQLETQFLQVQKVESIGRLAGGIAHDFNNLLTAISGYVDLALGTLPPEHEVRSDLAEVQKAAQRAANLTRQLLAFARKQPIDSHVINLNDLIQEMDKLLRRVIGEQIELVTLPAPTLWSVRADPGQIEQVLLNLVINARDAMPMGGKVTIETRNVVLDQAYTRAHISMVEGSYVLLAVSDTGCGMDAETQTHLFEPFFTTKAPGQGTGLGLATCYGIVKQHGGFIWAYSELGHGTSIKIYLPQVEAAAEALPQYEELSVLPQGTETVLVVEDELAVRIFAVRVLREHGYTVLEASTSVEAFQLAHEYAGNIDLLLTDVVMPQTGGKALAEQLTAQYPTIKVLFMSGYADNAIVHHGLLETGIAFLHKPFSPAALLRKVREVLEAAGADIGT